MLLKIDKQTFQDVTDYEVWLALLLLYPNLGTLAKENGEERVRKPCLPLFEALDSELIADFRAIFKNNNQELICKFFSNPFIVRLWNVIAPLLERET